MKFAASSGAKRAVFLDRDGTLNHDPGYLAKAEEMHLFPLIGEALLDLTKAGFELVIISNQSGVGRGLIPKSELLRIHQRMNDLLAQYHVRIDHLYLCLHRPEENCPCRKPKPKLILDAAQELNLDIRGSFMVGDRESDLKVGRAAGCGGVALVRTGNGAETEKTIKPGDVDFIGDSLCDVARWILAKK